MRNEIFKLREQIKFTIFRPLLLKLGNWIGRYSIVGDYPMYDKNNFDAAKILEENWEGIQQELLAILPYRTNMPSIQDIQQEQKILNQDDNWKTYFFYGFGIKATNNCASCPFTTSVIDSIEGMKTAFFSILSPGKHIPAHKGIYKGLIRMHLGLIVPKNADNCTMRIEKEKITWEEGKVVVFDDTYEHEVWNNTNEIRVVLLLDIIRPFKNPFTFINNTLVNFIGNSSYVREAMKSHQKWEAKFHDKMQPQI